MATKRLWSLLCIICFTIIHIGCTKKSQVFIRTNIDVLRFNSKDIDNNFRYYSGEKHTPYLDTVLSITVENKSKRKITIDLDSVYISFNFYLYRKDRKPRAESFVFRLYDKNDEEILFDSGQVDLEEPRYDTLEFDMEPTPYEIAANQSRTFRQKVVLPFIGVISFEKLSKEKFDRIAYGRICLFNGHKKKLYGIEGVVCSEPFLIRH